MIMKKDISSGVKNRFFSILILPIFFTTALAAFPFSCSSIRSKGVFKSVDRGENWEQKVTISKSASLSSTGVLNIALDPKNSQIVYLGSRGEGIYKSMDGGNIWYHLDDSSGALSNRSNVYDIAIDPKNTNNIYVGTYQDKLGRLFRSNDAGKTWEEVYRVSREQYAIFAVEVDSYDSSVVYMGTAEGGLLKSTDYGKNWKIIKWFDDVITDIKVNPYDTRTVYVSTYDSGVFKTTDKGDSWQKIESLKNFNEAGEMQVLVMDKNNPNVLYTGSKTGLLKSSNGGQDWQRVNIVIPANAVQISAIALDPLTSTYLYYSAGNVIYRTNDNGQTWSVHPVVSDSVIKTITIDGSNPNVLYLGMHDK
jgi:photosystem II stability/assembly factor-like uncharacterized protein